MSTKVLLVDDHRIVRRGIRSLLAECSSVEVVGEADNGRIAIDLVAELTPDIVIMDVDMPDLNGPMATEHIVAEHPQCKVIALSIHIDKRYVTDMLSAGAMAYLLKTCELEELLNAIDLVASGHKYLSPEVTGIVVAGYTRNGLDSNTSSPYELTSREREVLQLIAEGRSSKEIGRLLHVSVKTVTTHRQHVMSKLDIHSVAELTKYAIREGLTSLNS